MSAKGGISITAPYQSLGQKPPIQSTKPVPQKPGSLSIKSKKAPKVPGSFRSEDAVTMSENHSNKQVPLEPLRVSQVSSIASGGGYAPSRPQPLAQDEETPLVSQHDEEQSYGDPPLTEPPSTLAEFAEERDRTVHGADESSTALSKKAEDAQSSLLNAMSFHRRSSHQIASVVHTSVLHTPALGTSSVAASPEELMVPEDPEGQWQSELPQFEETKDEPRSMIQVYQDPAIIVTESDLDLNIDENVVGASAPARSQRGDKETEDVLGEDDDDLGEEDIDDGEQRYETEGEDSHQETLNDRIMALPVVPRTPQAEGTPQLGSPSLDLDEWEIVADMENSSDLMAEENQLGVHSQNRTVARYSQHNRSQMQSLLARSQVPLPRRGAGRGGAAPA